MSRLFLTEFEGLFLVTLEIVKQYSWPSNKTSTHHNPPVDFSHKRKYIHIRWELTAFQAIPY